MKTALASSADALRWLLLVHQLPPKPAYFRVKIWRRLQGLGAVAVKSSVYALPASEQAQEDFQWLLKEINEGGGEAVICEARLIDGLSDAEVRGLFDQARDADYQALAAEARALADAVAAAAPEKRTELSGQAIRLRRRFAQVTAIDFFGANGRVPLEGLLSQIEARLKAAEPAAEAKLPSGPDLKGKLWVTRQGVHVDRIACAWAVRRFVDPDAAFKFVANKNYMAAPGEICFDMFEGEITHEGDKCSLEVLIERAGLSDPALQAIAEIVHDIDLKDGKFGREETPGIAHLVAGICMADRSDDQRIARGSAVLNDLYEYFRRKRG